MKYIIKLIILSFVILQTACSVFVSQTESREVGKFTALKISGLAEVIITQANEQKLVVKVSGMPIADVVTTRENETLTITTKGYHRGGYLRRAMAAGVKGYLLKDAPSDSLADAVRKIHAGKVIVAPELVTEAWAAEDPLGDNERKILRFSLEGHSTKEIAELISLSAGTVRNYLSEVTSKLGAKNRIEAARIAKQKGWL